MFSRNGCWKACDSRINPQRMGPQGSKEHQNHHETIKFDPSKRPQQEQEGVFVWVKETDCEKVGRYF